MHHCAMFHITHYAVVMTLACCYAKHVPVLQCFALSAVQTVRNPHESHIIPHTIAASDSHYYTTKTSTEFTYKMFSRGLCLSNCLVSLASWETQAPVG